ncbi:MAG: hypothetical protein L0216_20720 [Planctomycetales bacterium]|nr:hypothetical protein [Planctomycetales bacterium]
MTVLHQLSLRWGLEAARGLVGPIPAAGGSVATRARVQTSSGGLWVTIQGRNGKNLRRWFRHGERGRAQMCALLRAQPEPREAVVEAVGDGSEVAGFIRGACGYTEVRTECPTQAGRPESPEGGVRRG